MKKIIPLTDEKGMHVRRKPLKGDIIYLNGKFQKAEFDFFETYHFIYQEVTVKPKIGQRVYLPSFYMYGGYTDIHWNDSNHHKRLLEAGLVFETTEEASNHSNEIIESRRNK